MALCRTVLRGRSRIHLLGVEGALSPHGGEELFAILKDHKPRHVLMESFAGIDDVQTGGEVLYRNHLHPFGLTKAVALMENQSFRSQLSTEVVGVLGALHVGAAVLFADRLHTVSFDRLVARISLEETYLESAKAADKFATVLEENKVQSSAEAPAPWTSELLLQNLLCPFFPELWSERHRVMAHVARQAVEASDSDVVAVVGSKHVKPLVEVLEGEEEQRSAVDGLLRAPEDAHAGQDLRASGLSAALREEVEKRAALAALLVSTRAFPAEYVLPSTEDLLPEVKEVAGPVYLRCRQAMRERLGGFDSFQSQQNPVDAMRPRYLALSQLEEFCSKLAGGELGT